MSEFIPREKGVYTVWALKPSVHHTYAQHRYHTINHDAQTRHDDATARVKKESSHRRAIKRMPPNMQEHAAFTRKIKLEVQREKAKQLKKLIAKYHDQYAQIRESRNGGNPEKQKALQKVADSERKLYKLRQSGHVPGQ